MVSSDLSDAELVERSRAGDLRAFEGLVIRYQRLVVGVALGQVGDPDLAEDLAQDAFVCAWRDLAALRQPERVAGWLAGIARNLARGASRRAARRAARVAEAAPPRVPAPSPAEQVAARQDRELLRRCLAEVPAAQREVLVLHYLEDCPVARIAALLGVSQDVVKQRLSRGRRRLGRRVAEVEGLFGRVRPGAGLAAATLAALAGARAASASALAPGTGSASASGAASPSAPATAGKVIATMTVKKTALALGLGALAVLGTAAYWATTHRGGTGTSSAAPPSATPTSASRAAKAPRTAPVPSPGAPRAAAPPHSPRVRRITPAERARLVRAIRRAQDARRARAAASPAAPPPSLPPVQGGDMDKSYIQSAVREIQPLLRECYESALAREPTLEGQLMVRFTIEGEPDAGGVIGSSTIVDDATTVTDPDLRECIQETMYAIQIDPPSDGGTVTVNYPFVFASHDPSEPDR